MRNDYLSRGKRKDNGEWETGFLVIERFGCSDDRYYITDKMTGYHTPILPETVGKCTGLTDKNDVLIFEGDVVEHRFRRIWNTDTNVSVVRWIKSSASFRLIGSNQGQQKMRTDLDFNIIGNIHDNPGLLENIT